MLYTSSLVSNPPLLLKERTYYFTIYVGVFYGVIKTLANCTLTHTIMTRACVCAACTRVAASSRRALMHRQSLWKMLRNQIHFPFSLRLIAVLGTQLFVYRRVCCALLFVLVRASNRC
jgi:hypothetical protein